MKKSKPAAKKPNKSASSGKSSLPLKSTLKKAAKTVLQTVKSMSAKAAKKPQTKTPPKKETKAAPAAKQKATVAAKGTAGKGLKAAPAKTAAPAKAGKNAAVEKSGGKNAPAASAKNLKNASGKPEKAPKHETVEGKGSGKGKSSPGSATAAPGKTTKTTPVAAVLAKPSTKSKKSAATADKSDALCREANCENMATTKGYCRLDYIKNWKKIKRKEMILKEGKLNQYIEELVNKYPDKYIDVIRQDLSTEVNFTKVIHDLELDESVDDLDYDGDSIDSLIGSIRKDGEGFDDDEF